MLKVASTLGVASGTEQRIAHMGAGVDFNMHKG
jgi:hypothetical protein